MRIVYHSDGSKSVIERSTSRSNDDTHLPLHERVMKSYYDLERQHKLSQHHFGAAGNKIRRTWEREKARHEAGIE